MAVLVGLAADSCHRILRQLQASTVSVLLLAAWQAIAAALVALVASLVNIGSSFKSFLLLLKHAHRSTASQLSGVVLGIHHGITRSGCSTTSKQSSTWRSVWSWSLSRSPAKPSPTSAAAAATATAPVSNGCLRQRHSNKKQRQQQQHTGAIVQHLAGSLSQQQQRQQQLVSCLPPQLPRHAGWLTVALDLDETLLCTYKLTPGADGNTWQLVPSSWPSWCGSSTKQHRTSGLGSGSQGSSAGGGYVVTTSSPCQGELGQLLGGHGAATLVRYTPTHSGSEQQQQMTLVVFERPGVRHFLSQLAQFAELVLYTAGNASYAQPLVDLLDPHRQLFRARLFADSTVRVCGRDGVKDLAGFGRDLSRVVLVDNNLHSFLLQPSNGLPCQPYHGANSDGQLLGVILPLLQSLAQLDDIRPLLAAKFRVREWLASRGFGQQLG